LTAAGGGAAVDWDNGYSVRWLRLPACLPDARENGMNMHLPRQSQRRWWQ